MFHFCKGCPLCSGIGKVFIIKTSDEITAEQAEDAIKRAGLFVASENQIY
jgi:hypothetical protein